MSQHWPNRWTGTTARVRSVTFAAIWSGAMLNVTGSMSAKTGRAPSRQTELTVAKKVNGGTMTSSPGPIPRACRASTRASVPDPHPTPNAAPQNAATSFSNAATSGPRIACPDVSTRSTAASISPLSERYWAWISHSGTGGGAGFTNGLLAARSPRASVPGRESVLCVCDVQRPCQAGFPVRAGHCAVRVARERGLSHTLPTGHPAGAGADTWYAHAEQRTDDDDRTGDVRRGDDRSGSDPTA